MQAEWGTRLQYKRRSRARRIWDGFVTFLQFVAVCLAVVAILGTLITGVMILVNHSDHVSCLRLHENTGLETRYARSGPEGECYIKVGDQWVPQERWIEMDR